MIFPKQIDWKHHMFKTREEFADENVVECALYGDVCVSQCENCVWLQHMTEEMAKTKVACKPPVIWER
ncbi:hypothetical protein SAMN05192534_10220 [Alteribacillus persepolensis]|uniref:Uncharacterized protein n=1 Tax=Alteribacillus persepolensis TaxID=568899 RepID=A0A1G8A648_9BACI|nr:hypothetical protein [Alteribacillus persepolensis]SDH15860.1 hypothetical protein SAMN05192534_10220 [Alteribacillus persepolensis]